MSTKISGRPLGIHAGQTYGLLTVIERSKPSNFIKHDRPYWLCQCKCGKRKIVSGAFLKRSRSPSCGCSAHLLTKNRKYKNPQQVTINSIETRYKIGARRRQIKWQLTNKKFQELVLGNCHYCNTEPKNICNAYKGRHSERNRVSFEWQERASVALNGIDRVNNQEHYTPQNCVSCCENCNKAKRKMTYDQFCDWIKRAYQHLWGV